MGFKVLFYDKSIFFKSKKLNISGQMDSRYIQSVSHSCLLNRRIGLDRKLLNQRIRLGLIIVIIIIIWAASRLNKTTKIGPLWRSCTSKFIKFTFEFIYCSDIDFFIPEDCGGPWTDQIFLKNFFILSTINKIVKTPNFQLLNFISLIDFI